MGGGRGAAKKHEILTYSTGAGDINTLRDKTSTDWGFREERNKENKKEIIVVLIDASNYQGG